MSTKICSKCKQNLPLTPVYFHRHKLHKDGFHSMCKECRGCKKKSTIKGHKICSVCNKEKPLEQFNNQENGYLGKRSYCRDCQNKQHESYRKSEHGKEVRNKWKKTEKGIINEKRYRNKLETKEKDKRYREINKERINVVRKKYRTTDRAKKLKRIAHQRRKSVMKDLPVTLTVMDWEKCLSYFNDRCAYCGEEAEILTQEHFIPVTKGGGLTKENIIPACSSCNTSKLNHDFNEWYKDKPFYSYEREKKILSYLAL